MIDVGPSASAADVARSYLASFASGDADAVAAHVAADFVNDHASALGSGCVGVDEYRSRLPAFLASFPGLHYEVRSVIADEPSGSVAVEYRMTATSDDRPIDIRGVMVMTVAAGLITRRTDYWDGLTFLRQIDQTPPPPQNHDFPKHPGALLHPDRGKNHELGWNVARRDS